MWVSFTIYCCPFSVQSKNRLSVRVSFTIYFYPSTADEEPYEEEYDDDDEDDEDESTEEEEEEDEEERVEFEKRVTLFCKKDDQWDVREREGVLCCMCVHVRVVSLSVSVCIVHIHFIL